MRSGLRRLWRFVFIVVCIVVVLALFVWAVLVFLRPAREPVEKVLFQGVLYERLVRSEPRALVIHVLRVDLRVPGVDVFVTPGDKSGGRDAVAQTTSSFVRREGVQVAINGSFFSPSYSRGPLLYYPHEGDAVDIHGLAISNRKVYSRDYTALPVLCFSDDRASIQGKGKGCQHHVLTRQAITGGSQLLIAGRNVASSGPAARIHPRSAVGLSAGGRVLWLVVVDGRQGDYSEGLTLHELAAFMQELGAVDALNMDGGGSSVMVVEGAGGPRVLSSPVHTGVFGRERAVGNHLGIFARGLGE